MTYPVPNTEKAGGSKVYFTRDISPAGLVKVYEALGVKPSASDKVGVKISTGEPPASNYLRPALIGALVKAVHGDIVEDNTAYGGERAKTAEHYQVIKEHGFDKIATTKILDEKGSMDLPVSGGRYLKFDRVGSEFKNYSFFVNLAHFKGHVMAGFGGVVKNQSIGFASPAGKLNIHSAGKTTTHWDSGDQSGFLCSMAEAAKAVQDYMVKHHGKAHIIYIDVMNNLSIDCDCDGHPAKPLLNNIGIAASLDPVALDKACLDMVYKAPDGGDNGPLTERIKSRNGYLTLVYAAKIGLGSLNYQLVNVD
jgi:uncharacterized Fe-S center protein